MFRNNLKIGFRNLIKRKGYTLTNSLGLSIGIASCILIVLYVNHQFSYDKAFDDSERIYKMLEERKTDGDTELRSAVPYSFVGIIPKDYPEVEFATAMAGPFPNQRVYVLGEGGEKESYLENNVLLADSNFFSVFSFKLISGDRETALKERNSVVLSERIAKKYFGEEEALGKFISVSGKNSIVTGVCEDPPANSHFKFSYLVSSTSVRWFSQDQFNLRNALCYFKLRDGVDPRSLERKFPEMVDTYMADEIQRINKVSWKAFKASGNGFQYFLRPLADIHLDSEIYGGMKPGGNITMVRILISVSILIFIIACINFMNLSTARSIERAKEVGVRKVMGSYKRQLINQFLTESFILSVISMSLAVGIVWVTMPYFNSFADVSLHLPFGLETLALFFLVTILISLLAGLYPAFVLSSFKPVTVLKGHFSGNAKGKWVKNGLVIFQFWVAIILISSTLIFQKQIQYLSDKDLGYDADHLMIIEGTFHMDGNFTKPYLEEIRNLPEVREAAGTLWVQGFQGTWSDEYQLDGSSTIHAMNRVIIGDQLAEVMNFELIEGAFFSERTDDAQSVILNEEAVRELGLEDPIGKKISMLEHDEGLMNKIEFTITGIIENFNYVSLRNEIKPLIIQSNENKFGRVSYLAIKLKGKNLSGTVDQMETKWKEMIPDRPFTFRFMDNVLDENYKQEKRLSTLFSLFSGLSIFIAVIGLFALSAYTVSLRGKEIGIRKIVGASANRILILLSTDFTKMIGISFFLAVPLAWYVMDEWLDGFAYRINVSIGFFIASGISAIMITWLTISFQTICAARQNPVELLKDE